jgi:hypothetical protein
MGIPRGIRLVVKGGRRRAAVTAAALALTAGSAAAASPASADTSSYQGLEVLSSSYSLDVGGASTADDAWLDVWYNNGNANQEFTYPQSDGEVAQIENQNSQMCITTDGVAGDAVYQLPCDNDVLQQWEAETSTVWWLPGSLLVTFQNPTTGLVLEVYNDSYSPGATVDAWYANDGLNQYWIIPGCSNPTPIVCE